jgi:uncharacterized protein (TIGR02246 family)
VTDGWRVDAEEVLSELQAKVSARDLAGLIDFFEDPAVLIGTAGEGRTGDGRREYLAAVTTQSAALRWDWQEIALFYESDDALGFAAFGEVVLKDESAAELRAPIRATLLAVRADDRWRLRQFHGSIPQTPT